ncbi:MAG TPA: hypothetical protein VGC09_00390 [Rhodopila sp.]
MIEPTITINGVTLNTGQSATLRSALMNLLSELSDPKFMADVGEIGPLYQARAREIVAIMQLRAA